MEKIDWRLMDKHQIAEVFQRQKGELEWVKGQAGLDLTVKHNSLFLTYGNQNFVGHREWTGIKAEIFDSWVYVEILRRAPCYRDAGFGRRIYQATEKFLVDMEMGGVGLHAEPERQSFWASLGFEKIDVSKWNGRIPNMRKKLN